MEIKQDKDSKAPEKPAPSGILGAFKTLLDRIAKAQSKRAVCSG